METLLKALKDAVIKEYRKHGDKAVLFSPSIYKSSYTGNEVADEIEQETKFGNRIVTSLVQLSIELVSRQKEKLEIEEPIELDFWYESNACWGQVKTLEDLVEKAQLQLASGNSMENIDDFLDKSVQCDNDKNYGTRREHRGKPLREHLDSLDATAKFIKLFGEMNK